MQSMWVQMTLMLYGAAESLTGKGLYRMLMHHKDFEELRKAEDDRIELISDTKALREGYFARFSSEGVSFLIYLNKKLEIREGVISCLDQDGQGVVWAEVDQDKVTLHKGSFQRPTLWEHLINEIDHEP